MMTKNSTNATTGSRRSGFVWKFADDRAGDQLRSCLDDIAVLIDAGSDKLCQLQSMRPVRVKRNSSRTVWRCDCEDGRCFFVKVFHPKNIFERLWQRLTGGDAMAELNASRKLRSKKVAAQKILAVARCGDKCLLVSRAIANARNLNDKRLELSEANALADKSARQLPQRRAWIKAVAELIADMHEAGVLHLDLHSGNIMFDSARSAAGDIEPIICDLHRIRIFSRAASRRLSARDIARLDHDCGRDMTRSERLRFLRHYLARRKSKRTHRGWAMLIEHLHQLHFKSFLRSRHRRVVGDNRYFARLGRGLRWFGPYVRGHALLRAKASHTMWRATTMRFSGEYWQELFKDIDTLLLPGTRKFDDSQDGSLLSNDDGQQLKNSASAMVVRKTLSVDDRKLSVIVKYARIKHKAKFVGDMLRPSRSVYAFIKSYRLLYRGIPTALPLACMEYRWFGMLVGSVLISEDFTGAMSAREFFESQCRSGNRDLALRMLDRIARVLRKMHDAGYIHRDLKSSNILVRFAADRRNVEVVLIDLDALSKRPLLGLNGRLKGLARFLGSLAQARGFKSSSDIDYFLRCYFHGVDPEIIDTRLCKNLIDQIISQRGYLRRS